MKIHKTDRNLPNHKDLVITWDGIIVQPAIYYDNQSFTGFYKFTSFYQDEQNTSNSPYFKVNLKVKHRLKNVKSWYLIDKEVFNKKL